MSQIYVKKNSVFVTIPFWVYIDVCKLQPGIMISQLKITKYLWILILHT